MVSQDYINLAAAEFANTYLAKRGWYASLDGMPRNNEGWVPWITYPAFMQISRLVKPDFNVFEYGCGASSLWWSSKVTGVVSVDHNAEFAAKLRREKPENLTVIVREMNAPVAAEDAQSLAPFFAANPDLPVSSITGHNIQHGLLCREFSAYAAELLRYPKNTFDVIVVDGMARCLTAWLAGQYVKPDGFIVFDNSDRWQYNAGFRLLHDQGFRRIDFYGPGPVNRSEWCTSLFVKTLDCLASNIDSPRGDNDLGW